MPLTWLLPLLLTLSDGPLPNAPVLSLDEHSKLSATPLDAWLFHEGPLPQLAWVSATTGEVNPDLIHQDMLTAMFTSLRTGGFSDVGRWEQVSLPHNVPGGVPRDGKTYVSWFATEFRVPPALKDRTVGLYIGEISAALRVYVNGELIGEQGRDEPDDFWPGRRTVLGYHIPPSLLHSDKANVVAVFVNAAHVTTVFQDVYVGDARGFGEHQFWNSTVQRVPAMVVTFMLLSVSLFFAMVYLARRDRVDALYFALGTAGLGIMLYAMWCQTWPFNGVYFLRLTYTATPLIMFYNLFFQRYYALHYHPGRQRWASFVLALWYSVTWVLPAHTILALYPTTGPFVMSTFFYGTFLSFVAYKRGVRDARLFLIGLSLFTFCAFVQALHYYQSVQEVSAPFSLGALCFLIAVLMAIGHRVRKVNESVGAYAQGLEFQHEAQHKILSEIAVIAAEVDSVSRSVLASVSEGQHGSVGQSSAVAETKAAMQSLLASGRNIMQSAQEVLHGAELTQRNNDQVAERLGELSRHSQRIAEILNVIREVANKSDLLALNAALEGVRAGPLGRGFTLVATQMQQLAETIMRAVADIRELTVDIREASLSTESSNNEATRLATDTTKSARQISVFIAEQQSGTEQVSRAMEDIAEVAQVAAKHGDLTLQRMQELIKSADRLRIMVAELNDTTEQV